MGSFRQTAVVDCIKRLMESLVPPLYITLEQIMMQVEFFFQRKWALHCPMALLCNRASQMLYRSVGMVILRISGSVLLHQILYRYAMEPHGSKKRKAHLGLRKDPWQVPERSVGRQEASSPLVLPTSQPIYPGLVP